MHNLLSRQPVRLKSCLSWDFQRSGCHAPEIPLTWKNGQTNLVPVSGRVPVLNLEFAHGRSGVQRWKICQKTAMEVVIYAVDFFGCQNAKFLKRKSAKQNPPENPPAENKQSAGPRPPPRSASQAPKSAKPTNQSDCRTSKYTPVFFSIEKDCSWRRLQDMDSGTLLGCLLGMVEPC